MNIAQSQERIKELNKQKEDLYNSKIAYIDEEIKNLRANIVNRCTHPEEFLLIKIENIEDDYGRVYPSWAEHKIKCSICNKTIQVKSSYIIKYGLEISNLFQVPNEKLKELR